MSDKILISGSSGFIGNALISYFKKKGDQVFNLVRKRSSSTNEVFWNPSEKQIENEKLEGFDAVINLNGVSVAKRWNKSYQEKILSSRVESTQFLSDSLEKLKNPPKVFFSASAIGYYGDHEEIVDEKSPKGDLFLSSICDLWEKSAKRGKDRKIRTVLLRFGMILGKNGGALAKMILPFSLGLGAKMGNGNQMISWISIDDLCKSVDFLLNRNEIQGPVNIVTPYPVTNTEFSNMLAKCLNRPCFLSIPRFLIELFLGQMGKELFLISSNVRPSLLIESGYSFSYPKLDQALKHILREKH